MKGGCFIVAFRFDTVRLPRVYYCMIRVLVILLTSATWHVGSLERDAVLAVQLAEDARARAKEMRANAKIVEGSTGTAPKVHASAE